MLCSTSNEVLLVSLLSGVSADREVCTTVALALLLLGTTSHNALVLGHSEQGVLNALGQCLPRRSRQQLFCGSSLSKHSVSEDKKGCSANSLIFRKSVEITWTLKPY